MELCSLVNVSSGSMSTGSISSPEGTPEMAMKRRRDRKSSSENSDSAQSRRRNKYANLPEEIAESKRQKVNQQERERQRLLSEVFQELRDLSMPPYVIPGHKSDSKYYLLKSAVCHIRELRQSNQELKTSAHPQGKLVMTPPTHHVGLDLKIYNAQAPFLNGGNSCHVFGAEIKEPTPFRPVDGCRGNAEAMPKSQPVAVTQGGLISKCITTPNGQVKEVSKPPNGQADAVSNDKNSSSKVAKDQPEARGVAGANLNGMVAATVLDSVAINGSCVAAAGHQINVAAAGDQINVAANGQAIAGGHDSVKSKSGRKRRNKTADKDLPRSPKKLKVEESAPPMDAASRLFKGQDQMLIHQLNQPVLMSVDAMKHFNLHGAKQAQKSEPIESISVPSDSHVLSFPQILSPVVNPQVRIGVTSSFFDINGTQNTPLKMALPTFFKYCQNTPGNVSLNSGPHQMPDTRERYQRSQNVQGNFPLPSLHFGMVPSSTQHLYAPNAIQSIQNRPAASTDISTTASINETEPTHFLDVQESESDSFNIFKNFVSYIST